MISAFRSYAASLTKTTVSLTSLYLQRVESEDWQLLVHNLHKDRQVLLPSPRMARHSQFFGMLKPTGNTCSSSLSHVSGKYPSCLSFSHSFWLSALLLVFWNYAAFKKISISSWPYHPTPFHPCLLQVMEEQRSQSCYEGSVIEHFHFYLEESKEHEVCLRFLQDILPSTFKR